MELLLNVFNTSLIIGGKLMQSEETKKQLIAVTKELLLTSENPGKITARQIASQANVNLAMINYCFQSKDELLKLAVDEIIATEPFNLFLSLRKAV